MQVLKEYLSDHRDDYDFIIANGENAAGGFGITRKHFEQMLNAGVDLVTLGNHTWDTRDSSELLEESMKLIRPANYPPGTPGLGFVRCEARTGERLVVAQVMGRVFMDALDCPFHAVDSIVEQVPAGDALIVDFHAEATSEKKVMGYHLSGRASAVIGTHTHVQTADETIMKGCAYITDVGMTGVQESSIGMRFEEVHYRFTKKQPKRYKPADKPGTLCALSITIENARATHVERIQWQA